MTGGNPDPWLALMCYEDRYPAFGAILETIAPEFPAHHFSSNSEFSSALDVLYRLAQAKEVDRNLMRVRECGALATLTRVIIDDAGVQARYGAELQSLVDELLGEIQGSSGRSDKAVL